MSLKKQIQSSSRTVFYRSSIIFLLFFIPFLFTNAGFCGWQKITQFPATVNTSFFFNEQRGFIGIDGQFGIFRTSDGGQTWLSCSIPSGFSGFITDIFMKDSLNGWATIDESMSMPTAHCLWSTTDGGVSWHIDASAIGSLSSVYQTPSALIITDRFSQVKLSLSTDGGVTFTSAGTDRYNGINFLDDLHGVVTAYAAAAGGYAPALRTSDGGRTWLQTQGILTEAWSVYAEKNTSKFFIIGEKSQADPNNTENVFASSDYGATWQTISSISERTTGHIDGVGSVIYIQGATPSQSGNSSGLLRSFDGGLTWMFVGGPSNYRDTRFSVTGCNGGIVYAFDTGGGVWKTIDGGDGAIKETSPNPILSSGEIDLSASLCSQDSATLAYSNFSCNTFKIESIGFSDSSNIAVSSGALSFSRYPKLPQLLSLSTNDSLILIWAPKKLGSQKPPTKTFIRMQGSILGTPLVFDTLLAVNLISLPTQPDTHLNSIHFTSIIGEQICTTFVLKNSAPMGNPPFILESAEFTHNDTAYHQTPISIKLPISVPAQDSLTLEVCFSPSDSSRHLDSLLIKTDCIGFAIALDGQGMIPAGVNSASAQQIFLIRPNPTHNELSIEYPTEVEKETQVEIFDALGKKVLSANINLQSGVNVIHLDIKNLLAGIYMIRIGESIRNFVKE